MSEHGNTTNQNVALDQPSNGNGNGSGSTVLTMDALLQGARPTDPTMNHAKLFYLARGVRGLERLEGRTWPRQELKERLLQPWFTANPHREAGRSLDRYWLDFLECYADVKHPLGGDTLERAWDAAEGITTFPAAAAQFEDPELRQLVLWCQELQRLTAPQPFFLFCASVMERFRLKNKMQARTWLRGLVAVEVLAEAEKGSTKTRRATRWRYLPQIEGKPVAPG